MAYLAAPGLFSHECPDTVYWDLKAVDIYGIIQAGMREYQEIVGRKIRQARLANNLTQESAAAAMGLDRAYYGRVERGLINLSLSTLIKICDALKIRPGSLLPPISSIHDKTSKESSNTRR